MTILVDTNPGRQNKIDKKRIEQVDTILRAATAVFAELGYAGARVDEIARRAGVNKATIYYRIGDKRELYARALHTVISDLGKRLSQSLNKEKDPIENIKTYIWSVGSHLEKHPYIAPIMLRELTSMGRHIPDVVIKDVAQIMTLLSEILIEGKEKQVLRQTNPVLFHFMVVGTIFLSKIVQNVKDADRLPPSIPKELLESLSGNKIAEVEEMALRIVEKI
jgi:AcrR family transcriptional regulator